MKIQSVAMSFSIPWTTSTGVGNRCLLQCQRSNTTSTHRSWIYLHLTLCQDLLTCMSHNYYLYKIPIYSWHCLIVLFLFDSRYEHNLSAYLCIPLPILHPAYISVIIHNRETDNPFSTDNAVCQAILKALQDSGPTLNQDCISLEIEDSSSITSSSSSGSESNSSLARSTPTQEDMLAVDSSPTHHAHLYGQLPTSSGGGGHRRSSHHHHHNSSADLPHPGSITPGSISGISGGGGHSSKASLACPEEINLEDVVLSSYGTTV